MPRSAKMPAKGHTFSYFPLQALFVSGSRYPRYHNKFKIAKTNNTRVIIAPARIKFAIQPQRFSPVGRGSETRVKSRPNIGVKSSDSTKAHPKPIFRPAPRIPTSTAKSEPLKIPKIINDATIFLSLKSIIST